jgi:hypothetical protein
VNEAGLDAIAAAGVGEGQGAGDEAAGNERMEATGAGRDAVGAAADAAVGAGGRPGGGEGGRRRVAIKRPPKLLGGATTYNPATGGVHAESLIQYGRYADVTSAVAGHSVAISDVSAAVAVQLLRTATSTTAAGHGAVGGAPFYHAGGGVTPLSSATAAAFTRGIPPSQGLLARPPAPALPPQWRRYAVYATLMCVPAALFYEYLFERVLYAGLVSDGTVANGGGQAGAYPWFLPIPGGVAWGAHASTLRMRVAWAQAYVLAALVLWLALVSGLFVYRVHGWRACPPTQNRVWLPAVVGVVLTQVAHSHVVSAAAGGPSLFTGIPWDAWLAVALWLLVSLLLLDRVKRHDGRRFLRMMTSLRAYFDTRLGMYSPK